MDSLYGTKLGPECNERDKSRDFGIYYAAGGGKSDASINLIKSSKKKKQNKILRERLIECRWRDKIKELCNLYPSICKGSFDPIQYKESNQPLW